MTCTLLSSSSVSKSEADIWRMLKPTFPQQIRKGLWGKYEVKATCASKEKLCVPTCSWITTGKCLMHTSWFTFVGSIVYSCFTTKLKLCSDWTRCIFSVMMMWRLFLWHKRTIREVEVWTVWSQHISNMCWYLIWYPLGSSVSLACVCACMCPFSSWITWKLFSYIAVNSLKGFEEFFSLKCSILDMKYASFYDSFFFFWQMIFVDFWGKGEEESTIFQTTFLWPNLGIFVGTQLGVKHTLFAQHKPS